MLHTMSNEVEVLIEKWEETRGSRLVCLCDQRERQPLFQRAILGRVASEVSGLAPCTRLDVLLESGGGYGSAAYQLATHLRSKCGELHVFVPVRAKSAATLFCLAADCIWMGATAELGPLDTQIFDPQTRVGTMRSALEDFQAVDYMQMLSTKMVTVVAQVLTEQCGLSIADALRQASSFTASALSPMWQQMDPMDAARSHRAVEVVKEYGKRLMQRFAYGDVDPEEIDGRILDRLVRGYPDHGFVIDRSEAVEIGLKVAPLDGEMADMLLAIREGADTLIGLRGVANPVEQPSSAQEVAATQEANTDGKGDGSGEEGSGDRGDDATDASG